MVNGQLTVADIEEWPLGRLGLCHEGRPWVPLDMKNQVIRGKRRRCAEFAAEMDDKNWSGAPAWAPPNARWLSGVTGRILSSSGAAVTHPFPFYQQVVSSGPGGALSAMEFMAGPPRPQRINICPLVIRNSYTLDLSYLLSRFLHLRRTIITQNGRTGLRWYYCP